MKEIIYTAIFIGLGILLILLLLVMFRPKKESSAAPASAQYIPGVYASSITLGAQEMNVEVSVDANRITSVTLVPLSDAVATMYPLMQPSLNNLTSQILDSQSLENISFPVLLQAIKKALKKAAPTA